MTASRTVRRLVLVVLVVLALGVLVVGLSGCVSQDQAAARRAEAEARLIRAETDAANSRSANRINEQNAAHQRFVEILTYVLTIGGGLLLACGLGFIVWDVRSTRAQQASVDPALLLLLDRQDKRLAELERAAWHSIASEQRAALSSGDGRAVVVYPERR